MPEITKTIAELEEKATTGNWNLITMEKEKALALIAHIRELEADYEDAEKGYKTVKVKSDEQAKEIERLRGEVEGWKKGYGVDKMELELREAKAALKRYRGEQ